MRLLSATGVACLSAAICLVSPAHAEGQAAASGVPSPDATEPPPAATAATPPISVARGAIVVTANDAASSQAKELARLVYQDSRLRPAIEEEIAQVLTGSHVGELRGQAAELSAVVKTIAITRDEGVRRRLLVSVGQDLAAQLVVIVSAGGVAGPSARIVRLHDERFMAVTLSPRRRDDVTAGQSPGQSRWDWAEAVSILSQLASRPPADPKRAASAPLATTTTDEDEEDDWAFLSSPWFWGGVGVVVTVGVTVLVLSQTALNDPDTVMLEGRVSP